MTAVPGTWKSPIQAADVARDDGVPGWVAIVRDEIWWDEPRPLEGGRRALVARPASGAVRDLLPPGWNARNRVIEYGGRSWTPTSDGALVFTNWDDQRVYLHRPGGGQGEPRPLTPVADGVHYAEPFVVGHEVWAVSETLLAGPRDGRREIVAVPLDGSADARAERVRVVLTGRQRFLTCPRLSPDGTKLAWIGWDHPAMPWDGTQLCVAPLHADRTAGEHRIVAGGPTQSVVQAEWAGPDALYAVTDPDGWWNLHRIPLDGTAATNLLPRSDEFGGAIWRPGLTWFGMLGDGRVAAVHGPPDRRRIGLLEPGTGELTDLDLGCDVWAPTLVAGGSVVAAVGGGPALPYAVYTIDVPAAATTRDGLELTVADTPQSATISSRSPGRGALPDPAYLSRPYARTFPGPDGVAVPAHVYPPANPDIEAGPGPWPFVVFAHGGPTGASPLGYDLEIAYFTSRGIGVVDVNYGGSTGYGRAHRERLRHGWGAVDVDDCAAVARGLVADGIADPDRLALRGGSAGGWTAVASISRAGIYRGTVAYYPITDPLAWAEQTHDFESRYLDGLVGPLPEAADRHRAVSPVRNAAAATGPVLLLHGDEDLIVEPRQSEDFVAALAATGGRYALLRFPGEQHGFRRAETIVAALEAELAFYGLIFGFASPDLPPLQLTGAPRLLGAGE